MEKINITVEKSTPVDGVFTVTLKAWFRGEQFEQLLDKSYTTETWTEAERLVYSKDFERNIRTQFEDAI